MAAQTERLQKVLAQAGVASRRHAETLIEEGHVAVNGEVVTQMGVKVSSKDEVSVDGVPVGREAKRHFLLYKPRGVITAVTDNKKRRVVTDFFEDYSERIYPVGRLDYDTSGLVIMTNDGDLANMLMHPKFEVDKQYVAKVQGIPTRADLLPLTKGIILDHKKISPAKVKILSTDKAKKTAIVELVIHQGMNHQVKKMLQSVGFPVMKLSRERFGNLDLTGLQPGEYREIRPRELQDLKRLANG